MDLDLESQKIMSGTLCVKLNWYLYKRIMCISDCYSKACIKTASKSNRAGKIAGRKHLPVSLQAQKVVLNMIYNKSYLMK